MSSCLAQKHLNLNWSIKINPELIDAALLPGIAIGQLFRHNFGQILSHRPILVRKRSSDAELRQRRRRRRLLREPPVHRGSGPDKIDLGLDVLDPLVPVLELLNQSDVLPLLTDQDLPLVFQGRLEKVLERQFQVSWTVL